MPVSTTEKIDLFSPEMEKNPYPVYRKLRDEYPLYFSDALDAFVISRYEDVSSALRNPAFTVKNYEFQSEPLHGKTFIQMDGAEHSKYRNVVAPSIGGRQLQENIIPIVQKTAESILSEFLKGGRGDFASGFSARFPVLVISGLLGLDKDDEKHFLRWYRTFVDFIADLGRTPAITESAFRTKDELTDYLIPIIRQRRENPSTDLLSVMCTHIIDGVQMTDLEIKAFISLLLTAGGESTDKMLTLMLRNLLQNPEQLAEVQQKRSLISEAFTESMRYSPVTHRLMRITSSEVEVSGGIIPANSKVILLLGAAQHDERQFPNPESFNIHRFTGGDKNYTSAAQHVAFGAGRHFCVGAMLAKAEIEIAFNMLFDRTRSIQLDTVGFPPETGLFTRGLASLPIRFTQ